MNEKQAQTVEHARLYAMAAHAAVGQKRKYTGEPYIVHPAAVVQLVRSVPHTPEMLAAAWLHDVVEDTQITLLDIQVAFSAVVTDLVFWLTDQSKSSDGNRSVRKAIDRAHSAAAPPQAQTIKLADIIDNAASIGEHDPNFAVVFRREKDALLEVMTSGDPTLMKRALAAMNDLPVLN